MQEIIERYIAAWNEADPGRRRSLIDAVWAADGSYTDPLADVRGREAIDAVIAAAQQQFPGLEFSLGGPVDANHQQARFSWHLGPAGGEPLVIASTSPSWAPAARSVPSTASWTRCPPGFKASARRLRARGLCARGLRARGPRPRAPHARGRGGLRDACDWARRHSNDLG
jgi:hypothetical protein